MEITCGRKDLFLFSILSAALKVWGWRQELLEAEEGDYIGFPNPQTQIIIQKLY